MRPLSASMMVRFCLNQLKAKTKCLTPRINLSHLQICKLSTGSAAERRLVYLSTSKNIYSNLAFEEWLYENIDLTNTDILLIWQNGPSVVIGRHQNPWLEANIPLLEKDVKTFARRSSGGGAVYHDEGNLNISFLKSRTRYDRKENLNLVVNSLTAKWDIDLKINKRDDIVLDGFYKVSGTAAKVGRTQSYHHFTLLQNVNKEKLVGMLSSPMQSMDSKSTRSVVAHVKNLSEAAPSMTMDLMIDVIANQFLKQTQDPDMMYINPEDEQQFSGVTEISQRLKSWEWLFGKTPKFSIQRIFSNHSLLNLPMAVEISVHVEKGCVSTLTFDLNESSMLELNWQLINVFERNFANMRLTHNNVMNLLENYRIFCEGLDQNRSEKKIVLWIIQSLHEFFHFL